MSGAAAADQWLKMAEEKNRTETRVRVSLKRTLVEMLIKVNVEQDMGLLFIIKGI